MLAYNYSQLVSKKKISMTEESVVCSATDAGTNTGLP